MQFAMEIYPTTNDAQDPHFNNLKFKRRTHGYRHCNFSVVGKTNTLIWAGEEIFSKYGEDYRKTDNGN